MKKIIAIDFDGTLVDNIYPKIENPNLRLINFIKRNKNNYIFILWTCRHGKELDEAVEYMKEKHKIIFDYINENVPELIYKYVDTRKVFADYYIDDKNINLNKLEEEHSNWLENRYDSIGKSWEDLNDNR